MLRPLLLMRRSGHRCASAGVGFHMRLRSGSLCRPVRQNTRGEYGSNGSPNVSPYATGNHGPRAVHCSACTSSSRNRRSRSPALMLLSITMRCGTVTAANHAFSLGLGNHSLTGAFTTNVGFTSRVTVVSGPPNTIDRVTTMPCNTRRGTSNPKKESPPSGRARQLLSCDGVLDGAAGAHEAEHAPEDTRVDCRANITRGSSSIQGCREEFFTSHGHHAAK